MSYESYRTVHDVPGIVLSNPVPTAADDMTAVPPVEGEIRSDDTALYKATNVTNTTVTWVKVDWVAM